MKIEICERCGKPGDYPECVPPYKPRGRSKLAIENNALQSRVAELEKERDKYKESLESIERDTNIYSSFSHEVAREALSPEGEPK